MDLLQLVNARNGTKTTKYVLIYVFQKTLLDLVIKFLNAC